MQPKSHRCPTNLAKRLRGETPAGLRAIRGGRRPTRAVHAARTRADGSAASTACRSRARFRPAGVLGPGARRRLSPDRAAPSLRRTRRRPRSPAMPPTGSSSTSLRSTLRRRRLPAVRRERARPRRRSPARRPRAPRPRRGAADQLGHGAGRPGPVVDHLDPDAPVPHRAAATSTGPAPCSIALAIRLPVAWASRRRSPRTRPPPPHAIHLNSTPACGGARPATPRRDSATSAPSPPLERRSRRAAAAGAGEVVQRERGAAQLECRSRAAAAATAARRRGRQLDPRRAAASGPRSSWHARATASIRCRGPGASAATTRATSPAGHASRHTQRPELTTSAPEPPSISR